MQKLLSIPVSKLFFLTLVLKVASSALGWALEDPKWFGCAIPLALMAAYIVIGLKRKDRTVSDEKFADTCYYLGFIFTVTSIIFSLFDLPHIDAKMNIIAARFGTAMFSTVFGLAVRVYLVSFREDVEDAIRGAEQGVIDAAHRLQEQLSLVLEKFQDLETQVDDATKQSVTKVSLGVEELTKSYGQKLAEFFKQLAEENKAAFNDSLNNVKESTRRLSTSVDAYSHGMQQNLQNIEGKVVQFADALTRRLEQTTFPDDYFAQRLAQPLATLGQSATAIANEVNQASADIQQSVQAVRVSLATMRSRSDDVEAMLERVVQLASSQEALLVGSQAQVDALGVLASTLRATQQGLGELGTEVAAWKNLLSKCTLAVTDHTVENIRIADTLKTLGTTLTSAVSGIHTQQEALVVLSSQTSKQVEAIGRMSQKTEELTAALGEVASAVQQNSQGVAELSRSVAADSAKALVTSSAILDATKRIDTASQELPLVKDVVHALAEQLRISQLGVRPLEPALVAGTFKANGHVLPIPGDHTAGAHSNGGGVMRLPDIVPGTLSPSDETSAT